MPKIDTNIPLNKEYSIQITDNGWEKLLHYCENNYSSRKIFVVTDEHVNSYYRDEIEEHCTKYFDTCHVISIEAGEQSKSVSCWSNMVDELLTNGAERTTPLLAMGGGVTGDVAGYAAASALRGLPLIHMPTSLLAMVDSSIGGKTGVNHGQGKNLIGAFYQPEAVIAHTPFLNTLPQEEWINGMAEIIKYAAICKPELFDEIEAAASGFRANKQWSQIVHQSAQIKSDVVTADVHEAGRRAILNFGHTFGHALEKWAKYQRISHGEAVFVGMLAVTHLSSQLGAPVDLTQFAPFKTLYNIDLPDMSKVDQLIEMMYTDKKVKDGQLNLILLEDWGKPVVKNFNDKQQIKEAWQTAFKALKT